MNLQTMRLKKKTKRLKALVKEIVNNPKTPLKDSMLKVDYSLNTAIKPSQVMQKPSFIDLIEQEGITDKLLGNKLLQGLEAEKPIVVNQEVIDLPDHTNRHKYLETALKLKGHLTNSPSIAIQANDYKLIIDDNINDK